MKIRALSMCLSLLSCTAVRSTGSDQASTCPGGLAPSLAGSEAGSDVVLSTNRIRPPAARAASRGRVYELPGNKPVAAVSADLADTPAKEEAASSSQGACGSYCGHEGCEAFGDGCCLSIVCCNICDHYGPEWLSRSNELYKGHPCCHISGRFMGAACCIPTYVMLPVLVIPACIYIALK